MSQASIIDILSRTKRYMTANEISQHLKLNNHVVSNSLKILRKNNEIKYIKKLIELGGRAKPRKRLVYVYWIQ